MVDSPIVKICGLRGVETSRAAIDAGATALGFNFFVGSRRRVTSHEARDILHALPTRRPLVVGVIVNESQERLEELVDSVGLDVIQLSGDETPDVLDRIRVPAWKVLRFGPDSTLDHARAEIDRWLDHPRPVTAILLDAAVPGVYGGSGQFANWELATRLARDYPVVLAGGLTPENVAEAIDVVRPFGVDVAGGVEVDRVKSPERIHAFITVARDRFGRNAT